MNGLWNRDEAGFASTCHLPPLWPWDICLTPLSLSFFICKLGLIIVPTLQHYCENQRDHMYTVFAT